MGAFLASLGENPDLPLAAEVEARAALVFLYDVVLERGLLSEEKLGEVLRPEILTRPQPILTPTAPGDAEAVGATDIDTSAPP